MFSTKSRTDYHRAIAFAAALTAALASGLARAASQSADGVCVGKQLRMVIAAGADGGYDIYARILVTHLTRHIPGNPTIIDQNMPTAAGMQATNWAFTAAPRDGTVILATSNSLLMEPLYGNTAALYDPLKFEFLGSISKQQNVCTTWHTSPIKTIENAKDREVIVPATGTASDSAIMPKVLNAVLGTKFKVILGYSTTDQRLAVERGEAEGVCGLSWSTLKVSAPDWAKNSLINVLVQTGSRPQTDLPNVPLLVDLVSDPDDKKVIELLSFPQQLGRPFLMPPETPKALVAIIRRAFDATLKDPLFLADAKKALLEIDPIGGEMMVKMMKGAYAMPKPLVQRAAEFAEGSVR